MLLVSNGVYEEREWQGLNCLPYWRKEAGFPTLSSDTTLSIFQLSSIIRVVGGNLKALESKERPRCFSTSTHNPLEIRSRVEAVAFHTIDSSFKIGKGVVCIDPYLTYLFEDFNCRFSSSEANSSITFLVLNFSLSHSTLNEILIYDIEDNRRRLLSTTFCELNGAHLVSKRRLCFRPTIFRKECSNPPAAGWQLLFEFIIN